MATPLAVRVLESQARVYRRQWQGTAVSNFLNPILYLLALGAGLGTLIDQNLPGGVEGVSYMTFVASGLLAANAMQTGAGEASWPVRAGIKWTRTYQARLASPISIEALITGHLGWVAIRLLMVTVTFAVFSALFGALELGRALLSVPFAVLTGLAYAAPITAFTARIDRDQGLASLFRFGIVPMFLFSGTFFPVDQLPDWLEPVALVVPLFHGVELCRWITIGLEPVVPQGLSVLYLATWLAVGWVLAVRMFNRKLRR